MKNKFDKTIQNKNSLESKMKKLLKIKELSANEKFSYITNIFSDYCNFHFFDEANLKTYELYYEKFMIDDNTRHDYKYSLYFDYCYKEVIYFHFVNLLFTVNKLIAKGLDIEKLPVEEKTFLKRILSIKEKFNMNETFNYECFYYDAELGNAISSEIEKFIDNLQKNSYEREK